MARVASSTAAVPKDREREARIRIARVDCLRRANGGPAAGRAQKGRIVAVIHGRARPRAGTARYEV